MRPQGKIIDIAESGDVPVIKNNQQAIDLIRSQYVDKSAADKKEMLSKQIAYMIRIDSIPEPNIKDYVFKAIERCDADEVNSLIDNIYIIQEMLFKIK